MAGEPTLPPTEVTPLWNKDLFNQALFRKTNG